jgi:hypothetical protein
MIRNRTTLVEELSFPRVGYAGHIAKRGLNGGSSITLKTAVAFLTSRTTGPRQL